MARINCMKKDLFDMPHGYCFAHCISNDFALGAGIATQFDERYNMRWRLKQLYNDKFLVGKAVKIDNVYNLITKEVAYKKPEYVHLQDALNDLAQKIRDDGVKYLAMPKIGAGLDKLRWEIVLDMIIQTFKELDIEIVICFLDDDSDYDYTYKRLNEDKFKYNDDLEDDEWDNDPNIDDGDSAFSDFNY